MITSRRGLLGMFAASAAAAIVRTPGLLMPIKPALVIGCDDHGEHLKAHLRYLNELTTTRRTEMPHWLEKASQQILEIGWRITQEHLAYSP